MTAIILAAGFSKRFGKKKLLIDAGNSPMIARVVDTVLSMNFEKTLLVYHHEDIKEAVADREVRFVFNPAAAEGLSTSVKWGIKHADETDAYIFFTGDQPFINRETVSKLVEAFYEGKGSIVVPRYRGRKGNPVIFASQWKEKLERITGDVGGREIIEANPEQVCFIEIDDSRVGIDIDTWEEYELYLVGIPK